MLLLWEGIKVEKSAEFFVYPILGDLCLMREAEGDPRFLA